MMAEKKLQLVAPHLILHCAVSSSPSYKYSNTRLIQIEPVITYIVARLPYSIFQTQYIFQPDVLHMRCWDEHFLWIMFILVDYCTLPCQDWVSGHLDLRTDVAIYVISEQSWMPSVISVLSHWIDGVSDGLYCMIMTQLFIFCYGYCCSYTDFCDIY